MKQKKKIILNSTDCKQLFYLFNLKQTCSFFVSFYILDSYN